MIFDEDVDEKDEELKIEDLEPAPTKIEDI